MCNPGYKAKYCLSWLEFSFSPHPLTPLAPPLEEEPEDDAGDSSSDDEKGGTISESLLSEYIVHKFIVL